MSKHSEELGAIEASLSLLADAVKALAEHVAELVASLKDDDNG